MTENTRLRTRFAPIKADELAADLIARLWAKVDRRGPDECWEWRAYRNRGGYGIIGTHGGRSAVASHLVLALKVGAIRADQLTMHSCDNPPCCNPDHLSVGTHKANAVDRSVKGRSMRGVTHVRAKLTEQDVRDIRDALASGRSHRSVGGEWGIDARTVHNIKHRLNWAHVV